MEIGILITTNLIIIKLITISLIHLKPLIVSYPH
jgi:hypothetical protein